MGTYDTIGGTPISPDEDYCEYWDEEKGCTAEEKIRNQCHHREECKSVVNG